MVEKTGLAGLRILVVEDWFPVAQQIQARLEELECIVVGPVPRLRKALSMARSEELDGAILDVDLNGERVYPVAAELQRRGIPFIFATGYQSPHVPAELRDAPRLEKPYTFDALINIMREVFGPKHGG